MNTSYMDQHLAWTVSVTSTVPLSLMCVEEFSSPDFNVTVHPLHITEHPNLKLQSVILEAVQSCTSLPQKCSVSSLWIRQFRLIIGLSYLLNHYVRFTAEGHGYWVISL
jgi:hypothetical protein